MALVNPNIAMSYRAPDIQPQNQLAQYAQMQQIMGGQQQQQLNVLKMQKELSASKQSEAAAAASRAAAGSSLAAGAKSRQEMLQSAMRDISQRPSDANITAHLEDVMSSELFTPTEKQALKTRVASLLEVPFEQRPSMLASQGAKTGELQPKITSQNLGGTTRLISTPAFGGDSIVVPGSVASMTMTPFQTAELPIKQKQLEVAQGQLGVAQQRAGFEGQRVGLEGKRVGLEDRRLAVAEKQAAQAADPAFQQRMSQARATGEAIAKGDVAAQQALPKIIGRAEEGLRLIDEMVGAKEVRNKEGRVTQQATKPHPGFGPAVGMGGVETLGIPGLAQIVPGTDAADFKTRFDQIKGASFLEAFESLKGGGAISEAEGTKATSAINRMSLAQSEPEFISAARDLQDVIRKGVKNAQTRTLRSGVVAPTGATSDPLGIR